MNTTPGFLEIRLGAALRPEKSLSEIATYQDLPSLPWGCRFQSSPDVLGNLRGKNGVSFDHAGTLADNSTYLRADSL